MMELQRHMHIVMTKKKLIFCIPNCTVLRLMYFSGLNSAVLPVVQVRRVPLISYEDRMGIVTIDLIIVGVNFVNVKVTLNP